MFAGSLTGKRVDLHRRALRDARQARQTVGACSHPNTNSEYTKPPVDNCRDGEQGAGERERGRTVDVHRAGAADALAAGPPEGQCRVVLVLDLDQCIEHLW